MKYSTELITGGEKSYHISKNDSYNSITLNVVFA